MWLHRALHLEGALHGSLLCYHHFEICNIVWRKTLHFHFVLGPPNDVCLLAGYTLCFLAQTSFFLKAEKRHWHQGKKRRLSGGKREYGDSGIFGEACPTQGLCCHFSWQLRNSLCYLSFKTLTVLALITVEQLLSWSFCNTKI